MGAMENAQRAARKAIESQYTGVCTVIEYGKIRDEVTKITRHGEMTVLENQPCKLSFEKTAAAVQTETAAAVGQGVKLFIAPEVEVKPGSKISRTAEQANIWPAVSRRFMLLIRK